MSCCVKSSQATFCMTAYKGKMWPPLAGHIFAGNTIESWPYLFKFQSVHPSLPSVAKDDRKQLLCLNIVFSNKAGPLSRFGIQLIQRLVLAF